jgi:hypothetical protein
MALTPELSAGLSLLGLLQVKHFICDGPLQTKLMVDEKRRYGAPMGLAHAGIHGLGTVVAMVFMLGFVPLVIGLGVLDVAIHYHVDFTKENVVKRMGWTPAQGPFWWAMSFDQMLHHLTYLMLTAIAFAMP